MSPDVSVRPLTRADLPRVAELVRSSFEPRLSQLMVATQHGWPDFVAIALDHPDQSRGQLLRVVEEHGDVVGFADFRAPGDGTGFLSYICVAAAARGRGIATGLLGACVREAGRLDSVALDVFADNTPARTMYDRLGFSSEHEQVWWTVPLPAPATPGRLRVTGLQPTMAAFERFGFCEVTGTLDGRSVSFGRMGESVVRVIDSSDFASASDSDALLAHARAVWPSLMTGLVLMSATDGSPHPDATAANRVVRMSMSRPERLLGEG